MPSWKDIEDYLKRNGYVLVRTSGRDKIYEKTESDGTIRRTAVNPYSKKPRLYLYP
jgi:hypothetical protein